MNPGDSLKFLREALAEWVGKDVSELPAAGPPGWPGDWPLLADEAAMDVGGLRARLCGDDQFRRDLVLLDRAEGGGSQDRGDGGRSAGPGSMFDRWRGPDAAPAGGPPGKGYAGPGSALDDEIPFRWGHEPARSSTRLTPWWLIRWPWSRIWAAMRRSDMPAARAAWMRPMASCSSGTGCSDASLPVPATW